MTFTTQTTSAVPRPVPAPPPAVPATPVSLTHRKPDAAQRPPGSVAAATVAAQALATTSAVPSALDIVLGERPSAVNCPNCGRRVPGLEHSAFEIETTAGETVCVFCLDKTPSSRGLRLATLLLNHALDVRRAGDHQAALDTIAAVVNGLELLDEVTPRPVHERPVRFQPSRRKPRSARRK